MTERVGQRFGNYQLLQKLGQGGFADVYLATHLYLQSQAAIKLLRTQLRSSDLEDFSREARTLVELKHPHILQVLDFGEELGTPYLVMAYAEHGTLRQRYQRGIVLPIDLVCLYIGQAASALQHAHKHKIIHRDIKPENMLLDRADTLLLSDFGIALPSQSTHWQSDTSIAGTAEYMAPEQIQGKSRRASDQYALAVVAYEWLTGETPFHGTFKEIASQHLFTTPPTLCGKNPRVTPEIEAVILRALAKETGARFATIKEFARALADAAGSARTPQQDTLPPTVAAAQRGPSSAYTRTLRAPKVARTQVVVEEEKHEDEQTTRSEPLSPEIRSKIIKTMVAALDPLDYELRDLEEEDIRIGVILFTCWLGVYACLLGISACVGIFLTSSLWPAEAIALGVLNLLIAPSAYLSTRHRMRTILLLVIANALALVLTLSQRDVSITDGGLIAICLIGGMVVGTMTATLYTTVIFPLLPRSKGYLLRKLPRVIGFVVLMASLWGVLWIAGDIYGAPAFIALHFLACFWSAIAWVGVALLIVIKGWGGS